MDIQKQLSVEQQFELKVFEGKVQQLSQQDAHKLLIQLQASMMYQTLAFREILKNAWGLEKGFNFSQELSTKD